jgi:tetratricopeptide (TPR) repeat protein
MDLSKALLPVKQLIGEGNIEQALEQLVALLDSDYRYAELAQAARVNQSDWYQAKAQVLKNTIDPDDARRITNGIADNALQIVRRLEAGKLTLTDPVPAPRPQVWRYYAIGGVAVLAAVAVGWILFVRNAAACPKYDDSARYRVMILPFKQTGDLKNFEPEFEIVDGLNKLISKTPQLQAGADVNENYNIEENYPSFTEAAELAAGCGVQMVVWGKINKSSDQGYKLDVFYKLLDAGVVRGMGDTTLNTLLKAREEGRQLTRDVAAITNLLYIVLANQARVPVMAGLVEMTPRATVEAATLSDSNWMYTALALADNYQNNRQDAKAIEVYSQVLETFPDNEEARQKRGALFFQKGDFAAAASDLDFVMTSGKEAAGIGLLKIRADANLKSGNPAKAMENLQQLQETGGAQDKWLNEKIQETRDTMSKLQKRLDALEKQAEARPKDVKTQLEAAKTNAKLGRLDKALNYADKALKTNPQSETAYEIKVETQLARGDTTAAVKTIRTAEQNGVSAKSIDKWRPSIKNLGALREKGQ